MKEIFNQQHLINMMISLLLIVVLLIIVLILFKKSDKKRILRIMAYVFIGLELVKISYIFYTYGTLNKIYLPFDFSGSVLIAYSIVAFNRGKLNNYVKPFAYAFGLIVSLAALIFTTNTVGTMTVGLLDINNFFPTWNFIFYSMMLLFALYLRLSLEYVPNKKDIIKALVVTTIFILLAYFINMGLNTNFMGLTSGIGNPFNEILTTNGFWPYVGIQIGILIILYFIIFLFL